jgi:HAD superfamily hydrolase (TIGR01509 family)
MDAVIFDLDGVLVDSEQAWDEVRRAMVAEHGGTWTDAATRAMQGMSTPEWARYLVQDLGARLTPEQAADAVVHEMARRYADAPPVIAGAVDTVKAVAAQRPVGIASSSPPVLIRSFLEFAGLTGLVPVAVSSEEVAAGKPAPDVYLQAALLLGVEPTHCAAVEDSTNGLRSAHAAGMTVLAVPNPHFPPDPAVLAETATIVLGDIAELPAALSRFGDGCL